MTTDKQYQWAGGSGGVAKPIPRVDKLARLYKERDALEINPAATRNDWLRLAGLFQDLRATFTAAKCRQKANEIGA